MGNFFTSLFSSQKTEDMADGKAKSDQKNFDILKYDGVRAQKMGKVAYAIKCFTEALNIQEDYETMSYLVSAYTVANEPEQALEALNRMVELEPEHINTLLTRANILFMLDREPEVILDCARIIGLDAENHLACYLMGRAKKLTGDLFGSIADLTRTVTLKEDFTEAYLLRADILLSMQQPQEALPDIERAITLAPEEESAYLLRGRIHEAMGNAEAAELDYQQVQELNPFNEEAMLLTGKLLITQGKLTEAIAFFDEAIEMNPEQGNAYAERGRARNMSGDKEGAFADLKKAIELNPEGEEARKFDGQHNNFDNLYKGGIF